MLDPVLAIVARIALIALFGAGLWHKLRDPVRFVATVRAYAIAPALLVAPVAVGVVALEGLCVGGLATASSWAAGLAAGILVVYAAVLGVNLVRGRDDIDCGCVGVAGRSGLSWWLVARNVVAVAVTLGLVLPPQERALVWIDWVTVAGMLLAVTALAAAADRLVANRPAMARVRGTG